MKTKMNVNEMALVILLFGLTTSCEQYGPILEGVSVNAELPYMLKFACCNDAL